jgi:biofilm PGA synthesis N-glycosyltransferase PgaC
LPFIVFMGIRTAQEQGIDVVVLYFMLFLAAHLIIAAIGIVLMREEWRHLLMGAGLSNHLRAVAGLSAVRSRYMAVRGVRAGWNKLARTGTLATGLVTVHQPAQQAVATAGMTER